MEIMVEPCYEPQELASAQRLNEDLPKEDLNISKLEDIYSSPYFNLTFGKKIYSTNKFFPKRAFPMYEDLR